jgi:hypothetical protein
VYGCRPRLVELVGGEVESCDIGLGPSGDQGDAACTAGEIEEPLPDTRRKQLDDTLVGRRQRSGEPLVAGAAPEFYSFGQSLSVARFVSSVRTFQSSG